MENWVFYIENDGVQEEAHQNETGDVNRDLFDPIRPEEEIHRVNYYLDKNQKYQTNFIAFLNNYRP